MSQKQWSKNDILTFGKHKGKTIMSVIIHDAKYLMWCIDNIPGFVLDNDTYQAFETFAETPYLNSHLKGS